MATIGKEQLLHSAECLSLAIEQPDVLEFVFDDDRVKSPILADGLEAFDFSLFMLPPSAGSPWRGGGP